MGVVCCVRCVMCVVYDVCWVVCDVCGVVLCGCAVWCVVCCGVLFLPSVRAGGVLFKTRTNHLEWLEKKKFYRKCNSY